MGGENFPDGSNTSVSIKCFRCAFWRLVAVAGMMGREKLNAEPFQSLKKVPHKGSARKNSIVEPLFGIVRNLRNLVPTQLMCASFVSVIMIMYFSSWAGSRSRVPQVPQFWRITAWLSHCSSAEPLRNLSKVPQPSEWMFDFWRRGVNTPRDGEGVGMDEALCAEEFVIAPDAHHTIEEIREKSWRWRSVPGRPQPDPIAQAWEELAIAVLARAKDDLDDLGRLPAEDAEDLHTWFSTDCPRNAFSLGAICQFVGASPGSIRDRLPFHRAAATRYSPDYLRAQRKRMGWTQLRLAGELGVHVQAVKQWETGMHRVPPARVADLERVLFPGSTCRTCGSLRQRLVSGGAICPSCSSRDDEEHGRSLDRGQWDGAVFLKRPC